MKIKYFLVVVLCILFHAISFSQSKIKIWNSESTIRANLAMMIACPISTENNNSTNIIALPLDNYHHPGMPHEIKKVAERFNVYGDSTFVLCYQVSGQGYYYPAITEDCQLTMHLVNENADYYDIDNTKVGAISFSTNRDGNGIKKTFSINCQNGKRICIN